jgi:ribosomal protein S12
VDNLLFSYIPEKQSGVNEDAEVTVREFMVKNLKIAKEAVDRMVLEKMHIIGQKQH